MKVNRIRKVANATVISLPRELEKIGFVDGAQVVIRRLPSGEVRLIPRARIKPTIRTYGRRNSRALDVLSDADRQP